MRERTIVDARRVFVAAVLALAALVMCGPTTHLAAQSPAAERRFDVASIKPALSPYDLGRLAGQQSAAGGTPNIVPIFGSRTLPGGRFAGSNVTLKQLVMQAFEVKDYQIDGGPKWLSTDYFEVNASAGGDATAAEINAMLKTLLIERFALKTHIETRQAPVYVLTVARPDRLGSALKATSAECLQQIEARKNGTGSRPQPRTSTELPTTPTCGVTMNISRTGGGSTILLGGVEVKALLSTISSELAAPAVDKTELTGLYDITLDYTSERRAIGRAAGLDPNSNDTPPPPLAIALEKQLGLKLEKQIGPLPIVVIDSAEHPTPD
jgi:uncharacterized protein (TIGR03435 family)